MINNTIDKIRAKYTLYVSIYFVLILIYRFIGGKYLFAFAGQPMKGPELDNFYWLAMATGIPHFVITHPVVCLVLDISVIMLALLLVFRFSKAVLFLLLGLFLVQTITVEIFTCAHSKSFLCIYLALIPCFFSNKIFSLLIEFARYFLIFVLVSAAYFKFKNGGLLTSDHFATVLTNQHMELAIMNPEHWIYKINHFLMLRPELAQFLFWVLFFVQLSYIVGVFTKKFDKILVLLLLSFAVTTYIFMRIYNFDIVILAFPLLMAAEIVKSETQSSISDENHG